MPKAQKTMLREYVKRASKDTVAYGLGNAALTSVSFFLVPIYTHIFSPADYGVLDIIGTASSLISTFLLMGLTAAVFRFYHDQDENGKRDLVSTGFWYQFIVPLVVCSIGALFAREISQLLFRSEEYHPFIAISLMTIPFSAMMQMPITLLRLKFQKVKYNLLVVGCGLFQTTLTIVLVVFLRKGLIGIFASGLISAILFSGVGVVLTLRQVRFRFSLRQMRLLLAFGIPMVPASLSRWVMGCADRLFLVNMTTLKDVGLYSVGFKVAGLDTFLLSAFQLAWSPIAYSIYRNPGSERVFKKVFLYFLLLSSAFGMFLSLFSLEAMKLLTRPAYYEGHKVVGFLALGTIFHAVFYLAGMGIPFANKMGYYALAIGGGAVLNLVLNPLLIPAFGMVGAAAATAFSYGGEACLGYYWARKVYPLRFPFAKVGVVAVTYVPLFLGGIALNVHLPQEALVIRCFMFMIFLGVVFLLLEREDRQVLRNVLKRARCRLRRTARAKP